MKYYLLSAVLVAIDQGVKFWVRANIPLGRSIPFLPHIMELTYVQNTGAAFSSLSELTWLLTLISLAASIFLAVAIAKRFFQRPFDLFLLSLLLGGAVGNLIDRAFFGFVTDMFSTVFLSFAVFNVADICVTMGGLLLAVRLVFFERDMFHGDVY